MGYYIFLFDHHYDYLHYYLYYYLYCETSSLYLYISFFSSFFY